MGPFKQKEKAQTKNFELKTEKEKKNYNNSKPKYPINTLGKKAQHTQIDF